jgi:hypothetical protein
MASPAFSEFRQLMDKWDASWHLFSENDLCMFFRKDGVLYGTTEPGRITFARMKNPESKEDREWMKEATFVAYDLEKTASGEKAMSVFGHEDASKSKIVSQDEAEKELKKKGKSLPVVSDDHDQDRTIGEK